VNQLSSRDLSTFRHGWKIEAISALILCVTGILLFFRADRIPGDAGDARYNMYVLEHGYRWLRHLDTSFWSAPFFYPAANVIAYSVNHLGSFLFYSAFRIFGASRESAFQLWALTIFILNYSITWLVLRKQGFHSVGTVAAAYLFTFPLIMAAQIGHIQLAPRFMVPVAFWLAHEFMRSGKPKFLCLLLAACAYQMYLDIYIGYFLVLALAPFCVCLFFFHKQWLAVRSFATEVGPRVMLYRAVEYVCCCIGFALALLPLTIPYYGTQQEHGRRAWSHVAQMLPRWQSYFYASDSVVWSKILHFGDVLPYRWEHQLFLGVFPYLTIIIFLFLGLNKKLAAPERSFGFAMMSVLISLGLVTFYFRGLSLYYYVWSYFPGAGGIRAVTRIMLVLVYPVGVILGTTITHFMNCRPIPNLGWGKSLIGICVCALLVIDQAAVILSMSKKECKKRTAILKAKILESKDRNPAGSVLWVNDTGADPFNVKQLDAMLAGQDLALNVINGFSGLTPKGYPPSMAILKRDCCFELGIWVRTHRAFISNSNLLQTGSHCEIPDSYLPVPINGFSDFEGGNSVHIWAIAKRAELRIPQIPSAGGNWLLSFDLSTLNSRSVTITTPDGKTQTVSLAPGQAQNVEIRLFHLQPKTVIKFQTGAEGIKPDNGDIGILFFDISNLQLKELPSEAPNSSSQ
jgi:hypothetical protein